MAIAKKILEEFQLIGRLTCEMGLNSSHSGNLSVRTGDSVIITRSLSMLANLGPTDLVEAPVTGNIDFELPASKETETHRAIYTHSDARAIAHAHPITATALSLFLDEIAPVDIDGAYHFPRVDVVEADHTDTPEVVADVIAKGLGDSSIVLSRGHGSFAIGESLDEALHFSCVLESSAQIIHKLLAVGKDPQTFQKDYFGKWIDGKTV